MYLIVLMIDSYSTKTVLVCCQIFQTSNNLQTYLVLYPRISKDPQLINIWTRATLASPYSTFNQYCIRCSPGCFATASTLPVITSSCSPALPAQEYSPSTMKASGESTISYTTSSWVAWNSGKQQAWLLPPVLSRGLHKSRRKNT